MEKKANESSEDKPEKQERVFGKKKYHPGRGARRQSVEDVSVANDDGVTSSSGKSGRRGKSVLKNDDSQTKSKFVFLGRGQSRNGKILKRTEESKFPNFSPVTEEPSKKMVTPRPDVSQLWSQHRKMNNFPQIKINKIENDSEKELSSKYDVQKTKTAKRNKEVKSSFPNSHNAALSKFSLSNIWTQGRTNLNLEDILKSEKSKKSEDIKPFLHLSNPLGDVAEKKMSNLEDLTKLFYSEENDETNTSSINQKRHYVYPPLHYKSSLHFSNSKHNDTIENKTRGENMNEENIVIPSLVLDDGKNSQKEVVTQVKNKPRMFTTSKSENRTKSMPKLWDNETSTSIARDPDIAVALKLVKMFRSFRDLHKDRKNLHSDLKQFLLEMSNMFR